MPGGSVYWDNVRYVVSQLDKCKGYLAESPANLKDLASTANWVGVYAKQKSNLALHAKAKAIVDPCIAILKKQRDSIECVEVTRADVTTISSAITAAVEEAQKLE